jgi:hypothetical protein
MVKVRSGEVEFEVLIASEYEDSCLLGCSTVYEFTNLPEILTAYIIRAMTN